MTRCAWWEISVSVPADAADAVAGIMEAVFAAAPVQCQRAGSSVTKVTVYLPKSARPDSSLIKSLKERISALAVGEAARCLRRIRVSRLKPENWRDSWKKHFRPIEFGGVLLIKPTWSHRKAKPGQTVVVLNPGLAFGTGHHATTAYCLDEIVRFRCGGQPAAFLDVGTGSGILAIAAAKLGYKPVRAIDIDPEAVRSALANARRNKVQRLIEFSAVGLANFKPDSPRTYGLVCANLSDDILLKERRRLARLVDYSGRLVVSGILRKYFARVQSAYEALGFVMERSRTEGEWRSGTFVLTRKSHRPTPKGHKYVQSGEISE